MVSILFLRPQAGAQISLADISCSEERRTKWYNLLSHAFLPVAGSTDKESGATCGSDVVRAEPSFVWAAHVSI